MLSPPDIDDLRQEGAIAAWKAESTYNGSCPLSAWKAIKARGARLDYARWWWRGVSFDELPTHLRTPATQYCEPRLMRAIARLPAQYRELIRLRYWEELTWEEIAGITGLHIRSARKALEIIHNELRKLICITPAFSRSRPSYWQPSPPLRKL